jgi:hypothetical protein
VNSRIASPPGAVSRHRWWPFAIVAIAYAVVALQQITLPGVYMDAVNPDYMAVRLLALHTEPITAWLLPGNYLFGRAPVLISFYHGSQQFWLGLPLFWLFGTTVAGLRLAHAMFALGVLAALYALLVRSGPKPWQAALACAALAIDPAFSYAFRTQSYITLAPAAWLFLALYCLRRAADGGAQRRRWLLGSGALYGLAVVGYFIYAFFLPVMLAALYWSRPARASDGERPRVEWAAWIAGAVVGSIAYPVGYALAIHQLGGWPEAWAYFQQTQKALNAFSEQALFVERVAHVWRMFESVVGNWFAHTLMFGEYATVPGTAAKIAVLAAGPFALWLYAEMRHCASAPLRVLIALPVAYCAVALIFGTRLSGHHFMVLLPIAYAALAVGLHALGGAPPRRVGLAAFAVPFALLAALNVAGQVQEGVRLHETRGAGLYSDAINQLAANLDALDPKPFVYFPDWGLSMPVAFLTGGRVGMDSLEDYAGARRKLCAGQDVALALVTGDRRARIEAWRQQLRWDAPTIQVYRQGDGRVVFEVATFNGRSGAPGCAGS